MSTNPVELEDILEEGNRALSRFPSGPENAINSMRWEYANPANWHFLGTVMLYERDTVLGVFDKFVHKTDKTAFRWQAAPKGLPEKDEVLK